MARPPLPLETYGVIKTTEVEKRLFIARARYRDIDGVTRPVQRTGTTKAKAVDALKEAIRDRTTPTSEDLTGDTRISALAAMWWEEYTAEPRSNGTVRRYKSVLAGHIEASIGSWTLREATVSKLDRFIKDKTKRVGYSTAGITAVLLSGMFDMAARHGAVDSNPMRAVAPVPKPAKEIQVFTLEDVGELRTILAAWDRGVDKSGRKRVSDLADPVDMFLATGCRPGEIFGAEWDQIDFTTSPTIFTLQNTMAKSLAGKWVIQRQTKGKKDRRLRLPAFATEMLMARRVDAMTGLVFPSSTGTPRIPDNFRVQWHAALLGTRFEGHVPREFRSTVATFVRDNEGIEHAQHQLGHSSLLTTEQRYARPVIEGPDLSATLELFNVTRAVDFKEESKR